ncbi:MAG: hypothetical protein Q7S11_00460 [bacterium]|nr:hypothetical protein [bacterium]
MKPSIIWIVVLILVVLGGWYLYSVQTVSAPVVPSVETQMTAGTNTSAPTTSSASMSATVKFTSSGFSPGTVTIVKGGTVTWVDESGSSMWIASAMHPAHLLYDNTSKDEHCAPGYTGPTPLDQCLSGANYSFTFNKIGTWKYHNHANESQFGTVIVQ